MAHLLTSCVSRPHPNWRPGRRSLPTASDRLRLRQRSPADHL